MSFDLAVWEGDRPASDEAAAAVYGQLMDRMESGDPEPPTEAISNYVAALLDRWPDLDQDGSDDSPWADGPLIANAFGSAIYFAIVWSLADDASEFAAGVAEQHGLVCFDPQSERLLPAIKHVRRRWFGSELARV